MHAQLLRNAQELKKDVDELCHDVSTLSAGGLSLNQAGIKEGVCYETASAVKILPALEYRFPSILLILHPTMNGFFTHGAKHDILRLKSMIPEVDRARFK